MIEMNTNRARWIMSRWLFKRIKLSMEKVIMRREFYIKNSYCNLALFNVENAILTRLEMPAISGTFF